MVTRNFTYEPDYAVAPGRTLGEILEERGLSQEDLAKRTSLSRKTVNEIIGGHAPITPETANSLEMATGTPARIWNNLERNFRERLATLNLRQRLAQDAEWTKSFPYADLIARGVVVATKDLTKRASELFRFFEVSDRSAWERVHGAKAAALFRRGAGVDDKPILTATWIQLAKLESRKIACAPYDPVKFKSALKEIQKLTIKAGPAFEPKLKTLAAAAGVAVVLVKEFKGAAINGAMFWEADRPVIALTMRGKAWDKFWFNFFHEAAHVLLHGKKHLFLDAPGTEPGKQIEREADDLAAESLIPKRHNTRILSTTTDEDIIGLAKEFSVHPCIVAGRWRHLKGEYRLWASHMVRIDWKN